MPDDKPRIGDRVRTFDSWSDKERDIEGEQALAAWLNELVPGLDATHAWVEGLSTGLEGSDAVVVEQLTNEKGGETATFTIKSSSKVTKDDLLNDDPIFPFTTRPSEVAEEITEIEDERVLATALGEPDCPPIVDDLPRVVAAIQTAAAVLSAVEEGNKKEFAPG